CETVGCESPTGSVRSHTHASPSSCAAMIDSKRRRVGSARALSVWARLCASCSVIGSPVRGPEPGAGPSAGVVMAPSCGKDRQMSILTGVDMTVHDQRIDEHLSQEDTMSFDIREQVRAHYARAATQSLTAHRAASPSPTAQDAATENAAQ